MIELRFDPLTSLTRDVVDLGCEIELTVTIPVTCQTGLGVHPQDLTTAGMWSSQERKLHINILEMKVVQLALNALLYRQSHRRGSGVDEQQCHSGGILEESVGNGVSGHV